MTAGAPKTSVVAPISVVIPVYNAERTLERCLEALLTGDCLPAEIVLVDNRSSDEGPEIMGRYAADSRVRIRVEFEPEQGSAAARNRGWRVATQPWVAFLDADCIPDPDWLRALRDRLGSNGTALAGDIRARAPHSLVEKLLAITTTQPSRETVYRSFTLIRGGMPTGNFALPRQMLEELGGLDNGFLIGHDHDLCARLYRAGYRIRFLREAVVRHQNRATWRGMLRQSWGYGEAHAHLLRVHFRRYWLLQIPRKCW
ncbi:MAG: glycosyltransferase, partial [Acidobacteria bacterium]|nr:glycosyltransferase [Acidobacteriota bacterium]